MLDKIYTWCDEKIISPFDLDFNKNVTLGSICRYLQEAAGNHAHHLDLGISHLNDENRIWILSKLIIKFTSLPILTEKIFVFTWPVNFIRLFARRDFEIKNSDNESLVKASAYFLVIDSKTRRPIRPDFIQEKVKDFPVNFAIEETFKEIPDIKNPEIKIELKVRYSDLDLSNHANNVKYVEWFLDTYELEYFKKNWISYFEIHFSSELINGDEIEILREKVEEGKYIHSILRKKDNKLACRARINWIPG